jgi:hypothetical protein
MYPLFLSDFNKAWILLTGFWKSSKFHKKIPQLKSIHSMRIDGQTGVAKLIIAFRRFAKAPRKTQVGACIHTEGGIRANVCRVWSSHNFYFLFIYLYIFHKSIIVYEHTGCRTCQDSEYNIVKYKYYTFHIETYIYNVNGSGRHIFSISN